jgi:hypothetical protein
MNAQQRVQLETSKDSILIGEVLNVTLELERSIPEQWQVAIPSDTSWLVFSNEVDTIQWEKTRKFVQRIRLTRYDSGYHLLSFMPMVLGSDSLRVSASYVFVGLPKAGEKELMDIRDPFDAPFNWPLYIALPIAILILVFLGVWLWKKWNRRDRSESTKPVVTRDPREDALQRLKLLADKKAWTGDLRQYYTSLLDVLRIYLESAYGIRAMEMTGSELARQLHLFQLEPEDAKALKVFLGVSDFAKYAEKGEAVRDLPSEIGFLENIIKKYPLVPKEEELSDSENQTP